MRQWAGYASQEIRSCSKNVIIITVCHHYIFISLIHKYLYYITVNKPHITHPMYGIYTGYYIANRVHRRPYWIGNL